MESTALTSNAASAVVTSCDERPRRKRTLDDKVCEVCNDKSTGKHYGAYCCDGCSGFFKRAVKRSTPWICYNGGTCVVDRASRTDCRACRFKKCLMVKMKPDGLLPYISRSSHGSTEVEATESCSRYPSQVTEININTTASLPESMDTLSRLSVPVPTSSPPLSMARFDSPVLLPRSASPSVKVKSEPDDDINVEVAKSTECSENSSSVAAVPSTTVEKSSEVLGSNSEQSDTSSGNTNSEVVGSASAIDGDGSVAKASEGSRTLNSEAVVFSLGATPGQGDVTEHPRSQQMKSTSQNNCIIIPKPSFPPVQRKIFSPRRVLLLPTTSNISRYPNKTPSNSLIPLRPRIPRTNCDIRTPVHVEAQRSKPEMNSSANAAVQLLSKCVQFAKILPTYKSLPLRDQIILLEETWKFLFILDVAFYSFCLDQSYIIPPDEAKAMLSTSHGKLVSSLRQFQELVARIQSYDLDQAESSHLKTIALFKPDIKGLKNVATIKTQQDEALVTMDEYLKERRTKQPARYGRLLLLLPAIERISQETVEQLFFRLYKDSIEVIIQDLFKKIE